MATEKCFRLRTVFTCVSVSLLLANIGLSQGDPISITPQSDTFAASGRYANLNYGDLGTVLVNGADAGGTERRGFLTFKFLGQTLGYTGFSDAKLELHLSRSTAANTLEVYGIIHPMTWDEHTLTWKTAPSLAQEWTLLGSCEVKPGDTSVVFKSEKLLELVKAASIKTKSHTTRSVSFLIMGRQNKTGWNGHPH